MTNNKQQTAVEWLIEQLHCKYGGNDFFWTNMDEIEQAKEMEKKQIILAITANLPIEDGVLTAVQKAELYYEKTYGNDKQ